MLVKKHRNMGSSHVNQLLIICIRLAEIGGRCVDREKQKDLSRRILFEAVGLKLPCRKAFIIAKEADCSPEIVGKICNEAGIKIVSCQLACF